MAESPQYAKLMSVVKTKASDTEAQAASARIRLITVLFICSVIALLLAVAVLLARQLMFGLLLLVAAVVLFACALGVQRKTHKYMEDLLFEQCNAQRAVDLRVLFSEKTNNEKRWARCYYGVADALFYAGRFDEARAVARILEKYGTTEVAQFYTETIYCKLCCHAGDLDGMETHAGKLNRVQDAAPDAEARQLLAENLILVRLLRLECEGAHREAYDAFAKYQSPHPCKLSEVERNYHQARMANLLGMRQEAQQHRHFVMEWGGTTYYKREFASEQGEPVVGTVHTYEHSISPREISNEAAACASM